LHHGHPGAIRRGSASKSDRRRFGSKLPLEACGPAFCRLDPLWRQFERFDVLAVNSEADHLEVLATRVLCTPMSISLDIPAGRIVAAQIMNTVIGLSMRPNRFPIVLAIPVEPKPLQARRITPSFSVIGLSDPSTVAFSGHTPQ
jgi:hypothetical protein